MTTKGYTAKVIDMLLGHAPIARTNLPSYGRVTVMRQATERRYVIHLLCASPIARGTFSGRPIEVVEDIVLVPDVDVTIRLPPPVGRVTLEPQGTTLAARVQDGVVSFRVDRVAGHQMVVLHDE